MGTIKQFLGREMKRVRGISDGPITPEELMEALVVMKPKPSHFL